MFIVHAYNTITSADVEILGLINLEFRYEGTPDPDAERAEDTCYLWTVTIWADGRIESDPHCDNSIAEDSDGPLEGIGGEYMHGGTFSYISDDHDLTDRYNALINAKSV